MSQLTDPQAIDFLSRLFPGGLGDAELLADKSLARIRPAGRPILNPRIDRMRIPNQLVLPSYEITNLSYQARRLERRSAIAGGASPPVDLMCVASATWEKLATAAETGILGDGYRVAWPSPLHLIALKLHAWKGPFRSGKERDWSDIIGLIDKCHIDLLDPAVREIVTRYGGDEALTKLDAI